MMIAGSGYLAGEPINRTTRDGKGYAVARVGCDSRRKIDGEWRTTGTQWFDLLVFSQDQADNLHRAWRYGGNVKVLFQGELSTENFTRDDGATSSSHRIIVDEIGLSLKGQQANVDKSGQ